MRPVCCWLCFWGRFMPRRKRPPGTAPSATLKGTRCPARRSNCEPSRATVLFTPPPTRTAPSLLTPYQPAVITSRYIGSKKLREASGPWKSAKAKRLRWRSKSRRMAGGWSCAPMDIRVRARRQEQPGPTRLLPPAREEAAGRGYPAKKSPACRSTNVTSANCLCSQAAPRPTPTAPQTSPNSLPSTASGAPLRSSPWMASSSATPK